MSEISPLVNCVLEKINSGDISSELGWMKRLDCHRLSSKYDENFDTLWHLSYRVGFFFDYIDLYYDDKTIDLNKAEKKALMKAYVAEHKRAKQKFKDDMAATKLKTLC